MAWGFASTMANCVPFILTIPDYDLFSSSTVPATGVEKVLGLTDKTSSKELVC